MKKLHFIICILLCTISFSQIVDEYPFQDTIKICGDEYVELNTPDGYEVIFWQELPFNEENNSLIHTTGTLIIDRDSPWAEAESIAWSGISGGIEFYQEFAIQFLDFPIAHIDIENYSETRVEMCETDPDIILNGCTDEDGNSYEWFLNGVSTGITTTEDNLNCEISVLQTEYNINDENYYYVEVTNYCGTEQSEEVSFIINECNCEFTIPNVFTPDGDNSNDLFPEGIIERNNDTNINCEATKYLIRIYDRIGRTVYNSEGYNQPWNGKRRKSNADCREGVYFYRIEFILNEFTNQDSIKVRSGSVSLFRQD